MPCAETPGNAAAGARQDLRGASVLGAAVVLASALAAAGALAADAPSALRIGGALRFNYSHRDWDPRYSGRGRIDFDTARIDLGYDRGRWLASAQYRYYRFRGGDATHFLHHAWLGYRPSEAGEIHAGVNSIPFGILPFASNNFFFSLGYYVGLEDSYNLGLKLLHRRGPLDVRVGYYPRDGGHWHGRSEASARYTFNIVPQGAVRNRERDTAVARLAYTYTHGAAAKSELGVSALHGRVPNATTGRDGSRRAAALHYKGDYGPWGIMLQAARYDLRLENPPGQDRRVAIMGAYDFPYRVAARSDLYVANLSYRLRRGIGPLRDLTLYSNYSRLAKHAAGFLDSEQQVFGLSFKPAEKVLVYVDYLLGRQHPYVGPNFTAALAAGGPDNGWHRRFNVNVGYYF